MAVEEYELKYIGTPAKPGVGGTPEIPAIMGDVESGQLGVDFTFGDSTVRFSGPAANVNTNMRVSLSTAHPFVSVSDSVFEMPIGSDWDAEILMRQFNVNKNNHGEPWRSVTASLHSGDGSDLVENRNGYLAIIYETGVVTPAVPAVPAIDAVEESDVKLISNHVHQINKFTDTGSGEIPSANFMLTAIDGAFITNSNDGNTPIIKPYTTVKLTIHGGSWESEIDHNDDYYSRYLFVERVTPQKNRYGTFLSVEAIARERYLQRMYLPGQYYYYTASQMVDFAVKFYNDNRGTDQPPIDTGSDYQSMLDSLPQWTIAIYEFGHQATVYDVLLDVIRRLTAPVADAGAGEQYYLKFSDNDDGSLKIEIAPQGTFNDDILEIENPISITKSQNEYEGNIVRVEGQAGFGSYPRNISMWNSVVEQFTNTPKWKSGFDYKRDAHVRWKLKMYRATSDISNSPSNPVADTGNWAEVPFHDYWATKFHKLTYDEFYALSTAEQNEKRSTPYSPWTRNKQLEWANSCGNAKELPDDGQIESKTITEDEIHFEDQNGTLLQTTASERKSVFDRLCFPDCNLVIRDEPTGSLGDSSGRGWRDWADFRVTDLRDIPEEYLYDRETPDASSNPTEEEINKRCYEGMRILVHETGYGNMGTIPNNSPLRGPNNNRFDSNGNYISNALVIRDSDGEWVVIKEPQRYDEVAVLSEGKILEFGPDYIRRVGSPLGRYDPEYFFRGPYAPTTENTDHWQTTTYYALRAGNDCFHYPYSLEPSDGLISNQDLLTENYNVSGIGTRVNHNYIDYNDGAGSTYVSGSAMKIAFRMGTAELDLGELILRPISRAIDQFVTGISSLWADTTNTVVDWFSGNPLAGSLRANDMRVEIEPSREVNIHFLANDTVPVDDNDDFVDFTARLVDSSDNSVLVVTTPRGGTASIVGGSGFGTRINYEAPDEDDADSIIGKRDTIKYRLATTGDNPVDDEGTITIEFVEPEFTIGTDEDEGYKIFNEEKEHKMHAGTQYNDGWWTTLLELPYPKATYGMPSGRKVGDIVKAPVINLNNLNETAKGYRGFGYEDSEELGELDGIGFLFKFNIEGTFPQEAFPQFYQAANIPFRATCYDTRGNVWIHDFTVRFQGGIQQVNLWFRNFKIYRARTQIGYTWATWVKNTQNPELLTLDSFSRRKLKRVTLQCMYGYDEHGRYDPFKFEATLNRFLGLIPGLHIEYVGEIDALHFIKTPIAIAHTDVGSEYENGKLKRHLEAKTKRYPHVSNLIQLQNIAQSEVHLAQHMNERWIADLPDIARIRSGSTVEVDSTDTALDMFDSTDHNADYDGSNNTKRRLIVGRITYSVGDRGTSTGLITSVEMFRKLGVDI